MAIINTLDFLPEIFRTDPNAKFLNATLDQLMAEPIFRKVDGYIGRTFAPTYKTTDSYITEPTADRANYQLEPSVVVTNNRGEITSLNSYTDLINQIKYHGGNTANHSRLFESESYTFNGCIDFDKLVNFSQYYWLPNGPATVDVFAGEVAKTDTFTVTRNVQVGAYQFSNAGSSKNPDIILARGGTYTFNISQGGIQPDGVNSPSFWIQTEPGLTGQSATHSNLLTREVHGVINNGASDGKVTFKVPQITGQDEFVMMNLCATPDLATTVKFTDIDNNLLSVVGSIDGFSTLNSLNNKTIVFVANDEVEDNWKELGIYALTPYGENLYDEGTLVDQNYRSSIWKIQITDQGDGTQLINLVWDQDIPKKNKVIIKSGREFADSQFYKNTEGKLIRIPTLTASSSTLYYGDGVSNQYSGVIRIVDNAAFSIDVTSDILGKEQYVSPNGVTFTNGLKIRFDTDVIPSSYASSTYYVEGVGKSIRLVSESALITPELNEGTSSIPFDIYGFGTSKFDQILNGPLTANYITINRSSLDGNAWSRSNRWFHEEVITASAELTKHVLTLDGTSRATRPIIEFDADLQLFNYGRIARYGVDLIDYTITDALTQVEGVTSDFRTIAGIKDGTTIVFANDFDPLVKNKIFAVRNMILDGEVKIHLDPVGTVEPYDTVIPVLGTLVPLQEFKGSASMMYMPQSRRISDLVKLTQKTEVDEVLSENIGVLRTSSFWFNNDHWEQCQSKLTANSPPTFDIIDKNGYSFGDRSRYPNSTFRGTNIFTYTKGTGKKDPKLGFPLSYRNFNNIGDIQFNNSVDTDTFDYMVDKDHTVVKVNSGLIPKIISRDKIQPVSVWGIKTEPSKQYQIISHVYNGASANFEIDILPSQVTLIPNLKVYVNSKHVHEDTFALRSFGDKFGISILSPLTPGDQVDILIYSDSVSSLGYYEIPLTLESNALNSVFKSLTLGQFRNHLSTIVNNSVEVKGAVPGSSNLRDLNINNQGGSILQHSTPLIYSSLFLTNPDINFINSASAAQREYGKIKNRILDMYASVVTLDSDISEALDHILLNLNSTKNKTSPWYYSDMLPYGKNYTNINYDIVDPDIIEYEIDSIFNNDELSNRAILVYVNNRLLVLGKDYKFNQSRPSIILMTSLEYNSQINIRVFNNTDGCFVPETPTKLGLYPKFLPAIITDHSYQKPVSMLRGHDGSLTPLFGDIRDQLLLEFETRIYNNIKARYIEVNFDINSYIPGKFRNTAYSKVEFDEILSRYFMTWAGNNRIDFASNQWYDKNNSWTWSYSRMVDKLTQESLPGHWRGIYNYFYDTDTPNTTPWEMLGFTEQPVWWENYYGPAPYTGGNLVLWEDLEAGLIRDGSRAGIDTNYARPGLSRVIPVNDSGELRSPDQFIVNSLNVRDTDLLFRMGDNGPVELAWRNSSDYPFALQQTLSLMVPGIYFGQLINIQTYNRNNATKQYLMTTTNQRLTPSDVVINGATVNGTITRSAGYVNWIVDYLTSNSIDPQTTLTNYLTNLDIRLSYRVAGYTDKTFLTVLAEQSSPTSTNDSIIIPDENYQVYLNKSAPVNRIVYSAVIIEKTVSGFAVSGYDVQNPFFSILPSRINSNQHVINVGPDSGIVYNDYEDVVSVPYGKEFTQKQQVVDFLISYGRNLTSQGFVFDEFDQNAATLRNWELSVTEFLTWSQQGWPEGNILIVSPSAYLVKVESNNAVVDAIHNVPTESRALDINFNVIRSNLFSTLRLGNSFNFSTPDEVQIGLLDLSLVQYEHSLVFDNKTVFSDIIYSPELGNRQYRLKLVGNKTGDWTGQMNPAGFVYSENNIKFWQAGNDYAKGDIVKYKYSIYTALYNVVANNSFDFSSWQQIEEKDIKLGLLPNLSYNASKFVNMYDTDTQLQHQNFNQFSNGLIGQRPRNYLSDLNLNATTQTKFYQGYIRDKGTKDAVSALASASFNGLSGALEFNEEWAFRVGEYGALNSNRFLEVKLDREKYEHNPIVVAILEPTETLPDHGVVVETNNSLNKKSSAGTVNIKNRTINTDRSDDIQTAGYVNLGDIDATIFDAKNIQLLNPSALQLHDGSKVWAAKVVNGDWDILRVDTVRPIVVRITYALDKTAILHTNMKHSIVAGQHFRIHNFTDVVDGFYTATKVTANSIAVTISDTLEKILIKNPTLSSEGNLMVLRSLRFNRLTNVDSYTPNHGWKDTDKIWIDDDSTGWAVYSKQDVWKFNTDVTTGNKKDLEVAGTTPGSVETIVTHNKNYGRCVWASSDNNLIVATSPGAYQNNVDLLIKSPEGIYEITDTITVPHMAGYTIGTSMAATTDTIVVNAISESDTPKVIVYQLNVVQTSLVSDPYYELTEGNASTGYGSTIVISDDGHCLFVAAPREGKVYCYTKEELNKFRLTSTIVAIPGIGFGNAMTTNKDGSIVVVSSPLENYNDMAAVGSIHVYVRTYNTNAIDYVRQDSIFPKDARANQRFGYSLRLTDNDESLLVGSPGYVSAGYNSGAVYHYRMPRAATYTITKNFIDPSVPNGVNWSTMSDGTTFYEVMHYSDYKDMGTPSGAKQVILKPFRGLNEQFGTGVAVDRASKSLMVSSEGAASLTSMTVDGDDFRLDHGATQFIDSVPEAGAVYAFDLLSDKVESKYCFSQEVTDRGPNTKGQFGRSVYMTSGTVYIGAPGNDSRDTGDNNDGNISIYTNDKLEAGWIKTRAEQEIVDTSLISGVFLYSKKKESVLANLDFIDPIKGKLIGLAEQELTYKTVFDPAKYNRGINQLAAIDSTFYWGSSQVGQLWWNLDTIRYVDYEQDSLTYRTTNWGKLFPGSTVEVCEWVASKVKPSKYTGTGTVKYKDDSAYVEELLVDPVSGNIVPTYYFWVANKSTVEPLMPTRNISAEAVKNLITSPGDNVPFAAIIKDNSIALFNSNSFLSDSDTVLHLDYNTLSNTGIIHNEHELVQENSASATIPQNIVDKLVDSLTGADKFGNVVPDLTLDTSERYGVSVRPRQTLFVDRLQATKNFVLYVNSIFKKSPIALTFDLSRMKLEDNYPVNFDPMGINLTVSTILERSYIDVNTLTGRTNDIRDTVTAEIITPGKAGQQVLVLHDEAYGNQWALYEYQDPSTNPESMFKVVKIQGYRTTDYWSYIDWYDESYDHTVKPTYTVDTEKDIVKLTLKSQDVVWVKNDGTGRFNVYRVNDDLSTSLVGVQNGTIRLSDALWSPIKNQIGFGSDNFDTVKFDLNPTIEFRNIIAAIKEDIFVNTLNGEFNKLFFVLLSYLLSEQRMIDWAFKTSYISIVHKLRELVQTPNYIKDNQTFYESYINEIKPYRTKIREYLISYHGLDAGNIAPTDFDLPSYYDADLRQWRSPNGEHARDAVILSSNPLYAAWLESYTFTIDSVQIQQGGYGYSAPPKLTVEGTGTGAVIEADIDSYKGNITRIRIINPGRGFTSTPTIKVHGDGIDSAGNQTLICYPIMRNNLVRTINTTIKFDRISYGTEVKTWESGTNYSDSDLIAHNGTLYRAKDSLLSDVYFDPYLYNIVSPSELTSAADRSAAYYLPGPGNTPNDPTQLYSGTEYSGVSVDGVNFNITSNPVLDSLITSSYTDMQLGQRPEDVTVDGGEFIDRYSSHAPEEFIPGMMFDTLDIKVFTVNLSDPTNNPLGFRISKPMFFSTANPWQAGTAYTKGEIISYEGNRYKILLDFVSGVTFTNSETFDEIYFAMHYLPLHNEWEFRRISASETTTLAKDLLITDTAVFVDDVSVLPSLGSNLSNPGVVYINGEKITYFAVNTHNNSLERIRRGVNGTGAATVHVSGSLVVDASIEQKIPDPIMTDAASEMWLNSGYGTTLLGDGLQSSLTESAKFIQARPSYLPALPGEDGTSIDPNANKTRFDETGHVFDNDPLDSYSAG